MVQIPTRLPGKKTAKRKEATQVVYREILENLGRTFAALADAELGTFQIVLCRLLRRTLPDRFGVCVGSVVTRDGMSAGDGIVIYNRLRFPTVTMIEESDDALPHKVPVEAVYAYVEARGELSVDGADSKSLTDAMARVREVKSLEREPVPLNQIRPYLTINAGHIRVRSPHTWPKLQNPLVGVVWANRVLLSQGHQTIAGIKLRNHLLGLRLPIEHADPDLLVLGCSVVCLPKTAEGIVSPYRVETTGWGIYDHGEGASAVGLVALFNALDPIQLGNMPWAMIVQSSWTDWPKDT